MPSVSNIAVGALVAGAAASKARHGMNESIARLSTGMRSMYGGDAAGQSVANTLEARSKSWAIAARNAEDGISALLTSEAALNEIANLAYRVRELGVQADNAALLSSTMEIAAMNAEAAALYDTIYNIESKDVVYPLSLLTPPASGTGKNVGITVVVISSGIEKVYVISLLLPIQTRPALKVTVDTSVVSFESMSKDIVAFAALLDLGTYPMFRASETTFSRTVAESRKDSFTTMFELNAVM